MGSLLPWRDIRRITPVVLVGGLLGLVWLSERSGDSLPKPPVEDRPIQVLEDGYVSSESCVACHPERHAAWHASYHRTMTQVASPESVFGDFANVELGLGDHHYVMKREGDEFVVEHTSGGSAVTRRIALVTGSHHMQVYWYPTGWTRTLGQLPLIYLKEEQRWIPRQAAFLMPPAEHQPEGGRWGTTCIRCHTTQGKPRIQGWAKTDARVAEFGIACEACHGPGEEHVRLNRDPTRRYALHLTDGRDPSIVNPAALSAQRSTQVCGQCHAITMLRDEASRREHNTQGFRYRPGDDLEEAGRSVARYEVEPEEERPVGQYFWNDGMIRVSGREYNGLLESPCYQSGELSCLSCHTMHKSPEDPRSLRTWANDQLAEGMEGNAACLQCHETERFDTAAHTHHSAGSSGSQCYNCHMPHTTYGLLKAIKSHVVSSPNVASSVETGRPNGCNLCHLDKSLQWTADQLQAWYGTPSPELTEEEQDVAASLLWLIRGDAGQRALIAWSMGWSPARKASGTDWMGIHLAQLLDDPYDAVRFIASRSLRDLKGFEQLSYDFVAAREQRIHSQREAEQMWRDRPPAARPQTGSSILIAADGSIRQAEVDRLRAQRNDTPLSLLE